MSLSFLAKLAAIGSVIAAFFMAVHAYNVKITTKAVLKEGERKEALYKPKFEDLTKKFNGLAKDSNDLRTQVITDRLNATSAANAAMAKFKLEAFNKTTVYQNEIKSLKSAAAIAADKRAADDLAAAASLRDATRPLAPGDGTREQGIRLGQYTDGLASLYSQCEKDLGLVIRTAAEALDRLGESTAAVRALSP